MKSNVYVFLTAAAFCLAAWSCSGENSTSLSPAPEMPEQPINPDALCTITPTTVTIAPVDALQTPLTRSATGEPEQKATYAENLGHNASIEATLEAMPEEAQTRAVVNLGANVHYRIVAYDNTGAVVGNVVYKQGSATPVSGSALQLKMGTYRLFAYSYNTTTTPALNADERTVSVNNTQDFMTYTDPNFTVSAADLANGKSVAIKFVRQFAKLTLTLKAEEYSNNTITAAQANLSNVFGSTQWTWNGASNTDASALTTSAGAITVAKASGNGTSVDCGNNQTSTPYIFVAPFSNQTIEAKQMYITLGGTSVILNDFKFPSVTLAKGGSYRLTITSGNYYVLTNTNPVVIGGKKWARTNLDQAPGSQTVFLVTNPWETNSYWSWGLFNANETYSVDHNWDWTAVNGQYQDPCRSLGSGWRLPTKAELESLLSYKAASGVKVKVNAAIKTANEHGWADGVALFVDTNAEKVLCLPKTINKIGASYWSSTHVAFTWPNDMISTAYALSIRTYESLVYTETRGSPQSVRCIQN